MKQEWPALSRGLPPSSLAYLVGTLKALQKDDLLEALEGLLAMRWAAETPFSAIGEVQRFLVTHGLRDELLAPIRGVGRKTEP